MRQGCGRSSHHTVTHSQRRHPAPRWPRRAVAPEGYGRIEALNRHQAKLADTFDAGDMIARLAGLAEVLIPAS
jgi:hypothetical protein